MLDKPTIPPVSGATGQPVSTSAPAGSSSTGAVAGSRPVCEVPPRMNYHRTETSASSLSKAAISERMAQKKIRNRESAAKSNQKKRKKLDEALTQFQKDNVLWSSWFSNPLAKLPKKLTPQQYLNVENIKAILTKPCFHDRVRKFDLNGLCQFVIYNYPVKARDEELALKACDFLSMKDCDEKTLRFLKQLRKDIRNSASADAGRNHRQQILDTCSQMRKKVEELELLIRDYVTQMTSETLRQSSETESISGYSEASSSVPTVPVLESPVQETTESPMDTGAIVSTSECSLTELLQEDSTRLYPLLKKRQGYYLVNGLPYTQYSLSGKERNLLISDELKDRLSMKESWGTGRFFELQPVKDSSSFSKLMKTAKCDPSASDDFPLGISLSGADDTEQVLSWVETKATGKKTPPLKANLHRPLAKHGQETLALYNTHESKTVHISIDKQNQYDIKSRTGVLLQPRVSKSKKSLSWAPVTEYCTGPFRQEDTNPLIRDVPKPLEIKGDGTNRWARDGEYFLTPQIVSDLAGKKSKTGEKPPVCHNSGDVRKALKKSFGAAGDKTGAVSLIFCDKKVNHTLAVRVLRKDNKALVYINETLDPASEVAASIRLEILDAVRPFFKQSELLFVMPGFTSQVDFSSCGVFAYKAIRAFDKQPELDEWLWLQGQKPGRTLHQANQYNRRDKSWELFLKPCLMPIDEMKAQLLKCYQGDELNLLPEQLADTVSHKAQRTLGEYLMAHQPFQAVLNGYKANLSSTGKRYKYLAQWQDQFLGKTMPSDSEMERTMLAAGDILTPEEYQLLTRFHPIIDNSDLDSANQWLETHMPGVAKVEESDWNMNCLFERFAFDEEELSLEDARDLYQWFEAALNHGDDKHHQLMQSWCIYIKQSKNSRFKGVPLKEIHMFLKTHIAGLTRPVAQIAGTKRRSPLLEELLMSSEPKQQKMLQQDLGQCSYQSLQPDIPSIAGKKRGRAEDFVVPPETKKDKPL